MGDLILVSLWLLAGFMFVRKGGDIRMMAWVVCVILERRYGIIFVEGKPFSKDSGSLNLLYPQIEGYLRLPICIRENKWGIYSLYGKREPRWFYGRAHEPFARYVISWLYRRSTNRSVYRSGFLLTECLYYILFLLFLIMIGIFFTTILPITIKWLSWGWFIIAW